MGRRQAVVPVILIAGTAAMQCAFPNGFATCPKDVLIVEDDPLIALDLKDMLLGMGIMAVRTAGTVATALGMITSRAPDFALLDVGLIREKSFAVAERLAGLKIPFAFVTGYGEDKIPVTFAEIPMLPKPYSPEALQTLLCRVGVQSGGT
jgi:DNA-binding response OmpR family regulator